MNLSEFYAQEERFVLSLLTQRIPTSEVEDIASAVWERVIPRWPSYCTRGGLRSIITSVVADYYRGRKEETPLSLLALDEPEHRGQPVPRRAEVDVADQAIAAYTLASILSRSNGAKVLTAPQHRVLVGYALEGLSMAELAEREGCGLSGVKLRMHRGRAKLKVAYA